MRNEINLGINRVYFFGMKSHPVKLGIIPYKPFILRIPVLKQPVFHGFRIRPGVFGFRCSRPSERQKLLEIFCRLNSNYRQVRNFGESVEKHSHDIWVMFALKKAWLVKPL